MLNFIKMEFLKLKHTKLFLLSLLCSFAPSLFVYLGIIGSGDTGITLKYFLSQANLYLLCIFGVFIFTIFASYTFGREYNDHTLKSILPIPISRLKYLIGKSVFFLIWILILCAVSSLAAMIFSMVLGVSGFSFMIFLEWFIRALFGGCLLFLVLTPLIFLGIYVKNMVPAMIVAAILTFGNILVYGHKELVFYPWALPTVISSGEIFQYTSQLYIPSIVLLITFVIGVVLSYWAFVKKDVAL